MLKERSNYYVYGHYIKASHELFYIGKGTGRRYKSVSKNDRSKDWLNFVNGREIYSVILFSNLTEKEAFEKEKYLTSIVHAKLVNNNASGAPLDIDLHEVNRLFSLSEESPSGLIWNVEGGRGVSKHYVGDVAGCKADKYWTVGIKGKRFLAHRVVYSMSHGMIPEGLMVDHIDGNSFNNKIENLRAVTPVINCRNKNGESITKSSTGVRGVSILRDRWNGSMSKKHSYVSARYTDASGRSVVKQFNLNNFTSEAEAIEYAKQYLVRIVTELRLSGHDHYTDRHFNF